MIKTVKKVLMFDVILFVLLVLSVSSIYANDNVYDSGVYDGIPWKLINFGYDSPSTLVIGEENAEYTMNYKDDRSCYLYPWYTYSEDIDEVEIKGKIHCKGSCQDMFRDFSSIDSLDLSGLDTSGVTNMKEMFCDCSSLLSLDLSSFKTDIVTSMAGMCIGCNNLETINLSGFNTENVTDMSDMFNGCFALEILDLSMFDFSKVTDYNDMFSSNWNLKILKIGKGFFSALDNDYNDYGYTYFPRDMYDYETGEFFDEDSYGYMPAKDYAIYVSDMSIDPGSVSNTITEDMLYGEYNSYLNNVTYKNIDNTLWELIEEGMNNRSGFDDWLSEAKFACREGIIDSLIEIAKDESGITKKELQKEIAVDLIYTLKGSKDLSELLELKTIKNFNKIEKEYANILKKSDKKLSSENIEILAKAFAPDSAKKQKKIINNMKYFKSHSKEFKKIADLFKETGRGLTIADAVISAAVVTEANEELITKLLKVIRSDSYLGQGLIQIKEAQEEGMGITAIKEFYKSFAENELISGISEDLVTEYILGESIGGAVGIAEFMYWGVSYIPVGATADDVVKAMRLMDILFELTNDRTRYRTTIAQNWENGGNKTVDEMKTEYALLIQAYYYSMKNCIDVVKKCVSSHDKERIEKAYKMMGKKLKYKNYIKSCLKNANTTYTISPNGNGTVTITGIKKGNTKNRKALSSSVLKLNSEVSDDDTTYIDIPAVLDGQKVTGISEGVFTNKTDLSMISLPDSVETIGDNSFQGCTSLEKVFMCEGIKTIGSNAFGNCISLDSFDMPDSLQSIANDAFVGIDEITIMGVEGSVANLFATENNYDFEAEEKSVKSISVLTMPEKTSYKIDEDIDKTVLSLKVVYTDGSNAVINEGFACWINTERSVGSNTAYVSYGNCEAEFLVTITNEECEYRVFYLDDTGKELKATDTGLANGGQAISVPAAEIEGYTPTEESKKITIGRVNNIVFEYNKIPKINIEDTEVNCINEAKYTGEPIYPVIVVSLNGQTLIEEKDYKVYYAENIEDEGMIAIEGIGDYEGEKYISFDINNPAQQEKHWHYSYLKYNTLTYTGKPRDPKPIVRDSDTDKALIKNVDYKVSYYSSHTAIGSHKVKITAIGKYAGFYPSTYTFKIIPGRAAIKSVARKKKAFTVKIKKQGGGVKYQYQYKTGKGKWKSKKIKKCALTVKKLKSKKVYKVRVRAFKKVGSKVYYGSWSKTRTVKTK